MRHPVPPSAAPARRIAVYGWDDRTSALLSALERHAGLAPVAVGDREAAALVRARAATGLPCYQHVLEMLRGADYDVALLGNGKGAAQVAQAAARRGAALFLVGDEASGNTLIDTAEAALQRRVPLVVLRPRLQRAGLAFLLSLTAADRGWRPRFLELSMAGAPGATALARDATVLVSRLLGDAPARAVGSFFGSEPEDATAVAGEFRYATGALASIRVRAAADERTVLFAECPLGELELIANGAITTLTMTLRGGRRETSTLQDGDTLALEAARAAGALGGLASDALHAPRDGAVLRALEEALDSGDVTPVEEVSTRANLLLVEGGGAGSTARSEQLRVVGR